MKSESIYLINEVLNKYSYVNKMTGEDLLEKIKIEEYPIGETMRIAIVKHDDLAIFSLTEMEDHAIISGYTDMEIPFSGESNSH